MKSYSRYLRDQEKYSRQIEGYRRGMSACESTMKSIEKDFERIMSFNPSFSSFSSRQFKQSLSARRDPTKYSSSPKNLPKFSPNSSPFYAKSTSSIRKTQTRSTYSQNTEIEGKSFLSHQSNSISENSQSDDFLCDSDLKNAFSLSKDSLYVAAGSIENITGIQVNSSQEVRYQPTKSLSFESVEYDSSDASEEEEQAAIYQCPPKQIINEEEEENNEMEEENVNLSLKRNNSYESNHLQDAEGEDTASLADSNEETPSSEDEDKEKSDSYSSSSHPEEENKDALASSQHEESSGYLSGKSSNPKEESNHSLEEEKQENSSDDLDLHSDMDLLNQEAKTSDESDHSLEKDAITAKKLSAEWEKLCDKVKKMLECVTEYDDEEEDEHKSPIKFEDEPIEALHKDASRQNDDNDERGEEDSKDSDDSDSFTGDFGNFHVSKHLTEDLEEEDEEEEEEDI